MVSKDAAIATVDATPFLHLFEHHKHDVYIDNVQSAFDDRLFRLLDAESAHSVASMIFALYVLAGQKRLHVYAEVFRRALLVIGQRYSDGNAGTKRNALSFAKTCLNFGDATIRDGAIQCITYLNDARGIEVLQNALARETVDYLRTDIQQAIAGLSNDHDPDAG